MNNLLTTIPKSKFKTWADCERVLNLCDGEPHGRRRAMFWLINCTHLPKKDLTDSVVFMVFDGKIRGYFHVVDTDKSENWRSRHGIGKERATDCIVMANWRSIPSSQQLDMTGFQGWRYTHLRP